MRIFISHAFDDEVLASKMKTVLEKHEQIEVAYMAQKSPNFELEISDKITREIQDSDYLVAIITKTSKTKPSVHQELGFAQGVGIHKIPVVEKNAKKGVLLEGRDSIIFEREQFDDCCTTVLNYIIEKGPTRKQFTAEEGIFAQKSAHFRYELESELSQYMSSILAHYQINHDPGLYFDERGREEAHAILENFITDQNHMYEKITKLELVNLVKAYHDYDFLRRRIDGSKRFPCVDLFPDEQDSFLRLNERIVQVSNFSIDIHQYLQILMPNSIIEFNVTLEQIVKNNPNLPSLPQNLMSYIHDVMILIRAVLNLDRILLKIRRKFGDIAFKNTFDGDTV